MDGLRRSTNLEAATVPPGGHHKSLSSSSNHHLDPSVDEQQQQGRLSSSSHDLTASSSDNTSGRGSHLQQPALPATNGPNRLSTSSSSIGRRPSPSPNHPSPEKRYFNTSLTLTPNEFTIDMKVVVLGQGNSGKSSFIGKLVHGTFNKNRPASIGVDYHSRSFEFEFPGLEGLRRQYTKEGLPPPRVLLKLNLWDIAGQEDCGIGTTTYYQGAKAAIIVYDVTSPISLAKALSWKRDLDKKASFDEAGMFRIPAILVGNKSDLVAYPLPLADAPAQHPRGSARTSARRGSANNVYNQRASGSGDSRHSVGQESRIHSGGSSGGLPGGGTQQEGRGSAASGASLDPSSVAGHGAGGGRSSNVSHNRYMTDDGDNGAAGGEWNDISTTTGTTPTSAPPPASCCDSHQRTALESPVVSGRSVRSSITTPQQVHLQQFLVAVPFHASKGDNLDELDGGDNSTEGGSVRIMGDEGEDEEGEDADDIGCVATASPVDGADEDQQDGSVRRVSSRPALTSRMATPTRARTPTRMVYENKSRRGSTRGSMEIGIPGVTSGNRSRRHSIALSQDQAGGAPEESGLERVKSGPFSPQRNTEIQNVEVVNESSQCCVNTAADTEQPSSPLNSLESTVTTLKTSVTEATSKSAAAPVPSLSSSVRSPISVNLRRSYHNHQLQQSAAFAQYQHESKMTMPESKQEIQDFINEHRFAGHFFASARSGQSVDEIAEYTLQSILKMDPHGTDDIESQLRGDESPSPSRRGGSTGGRIGISGGGGKITKTSMSASPSRRERGKKKRSQVNKWGGCVTQ